MPPKADPFCTKLHRRIDVILLLVTIIIIALVVRVSAHGQSAPSRARGAADFFSSPLALFQTGYLAGANYLALLRTPLWDTPLSDYAAANSGMDFSALAGLSRGSKRFAPTFSISEGSSARVTPVSLELGNARRSFTPSGSALANWSNVAGVGSTIPAYSTGFGAVASNASAAATDASQSQAIAAAIDNAPRYVGEPEAAPGISSAPISTFQERLSDDSSTASNASASSVKAGTSQSIAVQTTGITISLNLSAAETLNSFTLDPPVTAPDAIAAIRTWDGSGANDNWDTISNWDNNLLPANTDDVVFGTGFGSGTSIDTIANRTVNSLTFNTATGFSLGNASDTITITSGLLTRNDVAGTEGNHTLSSPITLGANGLWTINGSGTLTVSGAIGDGVNTFSLTKEGSSTLVLSGASTYGGATIINAGTLQLSGAANRLPTGTAVTLANTAGAILDLNASNQTIASLSGGGAAGGNILTGGATLTVGDATSTTYNGIISESGGSVVKQGAGTLTLGGGNSYTGATTISAGVLRAAHATALGTVAGGVSVASGAALELSGGIAVGAEALSLNGTGISGAGALRNVSGDNSWAGTITLADVAAVHRINSDLGTTLTIGGGIGEGAGSLLKDLTFGGSGNVTVNGNITATAGDMRLFKDGSGTLTLAGANTYDGGTTISGGTVSISANGNLGNTAGGLTFANGATLRVTSQVISTRTVTLNAGGATFDLLTPLYLGGAISGGNGIVTGGNDLILNRASGTNAIGAITVNSGRLFVQNTLGNINASTISVGNGAIFAIDINAANVLSNTVAFASGAGLNNRQGTLSIGASATLPGSGTMIFNNDDAATTAITVNGNRALTGNLTIQVGGGNATVGAVTFADVISGSGFGITKTSTGTLLLSDLNTYTGATNVTGGTLKAGIASGVNSGAFGNNSAVTLANTAGVILDITGFNTQIGSLTGGGVTGGNVTLGAATLTVGGDNTSPGAYAGVISGTGAVTKIGSGTLTLSGANTYTGVTSVLSGTLIAGTNAPISSAGAFGNASSAVLLGNTLGALDASLLTGGAFTIGRAITAQSGNTGVITLGGNTAAASSFTGAINLGTASGTKKDATFVALAGGTVDFTGVIAESASVTGVSNLTIGDSTHSGTVKFSNVANSYSGTTTIGNGSTLEVTRLLNGGSNSSIGNSGSAAGAGSVASDLVIDNGTLRYTGTGDSTNRLFTFGLGGATIDASAIANAALNFTGTGSLVASGSGARTLTLTGSSTGANTMTSIIADPGTGATALSKSGAGTWVLGGANTYSGGTTVSAGTLRLSGAGTLGSTSGALTVNGGTLDLNGTSQTVGALNGSGGTINTGTGTSTLTVGQGGGTGSYAGTIANGGGSVTLTKTGAGTQTLTGANTYSGATAVNAGTLLINGDQSGATGAVSVTNAGSVLGGTGIIGGAVTVGADAILRGGTGAIASGALTLASTVDTAAGIIQLALGAGGTHSTLTQINGGAWTFGLNQLFTFIDLGATTGFYDNIITGLSGTPNTNPINWDITNSDWFGSFSYDEMGNIDLTLTAVPEPSTWAAGILTVLALGWTQRRRLGKFALRRQN